MGSLAIEKKGISLSKKILEEVDVLCILSPYDQEIISSLKPWLKEKEERSLVFLEPASDLFSNPSSFSSQVKVFGIKGFEEESWKKFVWQSVFLRFYYVAYDQSADSTELVLLEKMKEIEWEIQLLASEFQDFGIKHLSNFRKNLLSFTPFCVLSHLKNRFQNIPAIICGAGLSLTQSLPLLSKLKDKAFIFAGGTASSCLQDENVDFHFGAGFDPDPPYHRFYQQHFHEAPFFYMDRFSHDILRLVHSPLIKASHPGIHTLEKWFYEQLGHDDGAFEGGWTVATFCTAISSFLGCNPIIFVGMDFALGENKNSYAKGAGFEEEVETVSVKNVKGKELFSKKDWIIAARWIEEFVQRQKESNQTFLQVGEEGIYLQGVFQCSLEEIESKYLQNTYDMTGIMHSALMGARCLIDLRANANSVWEKFEQSLEKCQKLCNDLLVVFQKHYPKDPREKGEYVLLELDLYDEIGYKVYLEPLWNIWKWAFNRKSSLQLFDGVLNKILFFQQVLTKQL